MKNLHNINDFYSKYKDMPKKIFIVRFYEPFLIIVFLPEPTNMDQIEPSKYSTAKGDFKKDTNIPLTFVASLKKAEKSKPEAGISIGRAQDNDIVLWHPSISRHHAVIKEEFPSGDYCVIDVGSKFGTEVYGLIIVKNKPYRIENGSDIILGESVHCTFLKPESFYNFMKSECQDEP